MSTLIGNTSGLILTRPGQLQCDNMGAARLDREYQCSKDYETTADEVLGISSLPIAYSAPENIAGLIATAIDKSESNGIITYSVSYTGVNTSINSIVYGNSVQSFSVTFTAGLAWQIQYLAPTETTYHISDDGTYDGEASVSGDIRIISAFLNTWNAESEVGSLPLSNYTTFSSVRSIKSGSKYIVEVTAIKLLQAIQPV